MVVAALLAAPVAMAGPDSNTHGSGDQHTHQAGNGDDGNWVSAWSASPQGPPTLGKFGIETLSGDSQVQIAQQIVPPPTAFEDETIRQVMYLHHGGSAVRIQVANDYGTGDTTIPSVTIGKRAGDSGAAVEGEPLPVTFDGKESVTIPKGERVLSDPVPLTTEALQHVVVSMYLPGGQGPATVHGNAMQTFFTSAGDQTDAVDDGAFAERGIVNNPYTSTFTTATYYATSIQVEGEPGDKTIVALGDSITDGFFSEGNTDGRYPDVLARRLKANPETAHLSVTNQAISAGRVLRDDVGPSTLNRLENDVLNQPNLGGVLFLQGINDIGNTLFQDRPRTADELIEGYKELAQRVHAAGVPIYIGTLTPAGNLARPTPFGMYSLPGPVAERNKVNEWLRTEGTQYFDGIVDHDKTIRDPLVPDWIALQYDALDNLHPNQLGYKTMAETIPQEYLDEMAG
ncbi:GDSL-type esterase/lipase family protein [Pseudonocardia tropica]|uniref:GDSL-type esterase/lipase family protein n=1 Tax=Pseudonocardia tropica TaxID=681289 RepID=A0ABV1K275_9PSEU